jgi:sulfoacetaldehyde acetyltransferase
MIIFRNYQWGAEKRNTTLWYDDNFVGTELNVGVEYAKVAEACGVKGIKAETMEGLTTALQTAVKEQMEDNVTTFIEVVLNQELGEPFRRDAMKAPVAVAGIDPTDMKPQQGS